jgi:hypothetical protein
VWEIPIFFAEKIYDDDANRCILLYTDMSTGQDKRINEYQTRLAAGLEVQYMAGHKYVSSTQRY